MAQITNHYHFLSTNSLFTQSWQHTLFSCRTGHLTAASRALPGHISMSSLCLGFSKKTLKFNDHRIIKKIQVCVFCYVRASFMLHNPDGNYSSVSVFFAKYEWWLFAKFCDYSVNSKLVTTLYILAMFGQSFWQCQLPFFLHRYCNICHNSCRHYGHYNMSLKSLEWRVWLLLLLLSMLLLLLLLLLLLAWKAYCIYAIKNFYSEL